MGKGEQMKGKGGWRCLGVFFSTWQINQGVLRVQVGQVKLSQFNSKIILYAKDSNIYFFCSVTTTVRVRRFPTCTRGEHTD